MFTVFIRAYRLAPQVDSNDTRFVWQRRHRTARAADRTLATIIAGRSALSKEVARLIPRDFAGRYTIQDDAGVERALTPHRAEFGLLTRVGDTERR